MTGWRSAATLVAAVVVAVLLNAGAAGASGASGEVDHHTLFRFEDRGIVESSGLVDAGSVVYTVNDSGDGPVLYEVDARTGRTTGVTTYSRDDVDDPEAVAPARGGGVWVGDIGDNQMQRSSVAVYRVRPGAGGGAPRFELTYPDGARDAEALLAHPVDGRLYVVSKSVFGGVVYAAPALRSSGPGRLRRFAQVPGLVTDGAFFPDGRHVLLRGYGSATVYTFPGFEPLGTLVLPAQRLGEGIAIGADGRILISSEGVHTPVFEVELPAGLAAELAPPAADPSAPGEPSPSAGPPPSAGGDTSLVEQDPGFGPVGTSLVGVLAGAGVLAVLAALVWATRRRP